MILDQSPILIILLPLFAGLLMPLVGLLNQRLCYPLAVLALLGSSICSVNVLNKVISHGVLTYNLGGWAAPYGIQYVVDHLNAFVLVMVAIVSFLVAIYSKASVLKELSNKVPHFYTLFVLLATGLLGITITGDVFNVYVLIEIAALTSYSLIALAQKRAYLATFNYLIIGSVGASFYLLGVGYLLIKTGSLNMIDIQHLLTSMHNSQAIMVAFALIFVGIAVKMAFFPMHGWLPNAYTYAPSATSALVAPLMTKVSVYVVIRMMLSIFGTDYVFGVLNWQSIMIILSVIAIISGSIFALGQRNIKKMLTYLIIAEIGYMMGGVWLGNKMGIMGATFHIVADGLMTALLFMVVGAVVYKVGHADLSSFKGLFQKMPLTMTGFLVAAFSMIGIPPTAGFFSKFYLLSGAYHAEAWHFFIALLISSLVNVILFFRIIEVSFFASLPEETPHHGDHEHISEAPLSMLFPILSTAVLIIGMGLYSNSIMTHIVTKIIPKGLEYL